MSLTYKLLPGQPWRRLSFIAAMLTNFVGHLWWLVLAGLSVPLLWHFYTNGLPQSYDGATHLLRLALLDDYIHQGMLYPRWLPELILGNGAPVFNYYAPLTYLDNVRLGRVTYSALSTEPTRRRMGPIDQMLDDQVGDLFR